MPFEFSAPEQITSGVPIWFSYSSEFRVSGRIRLTLGTEALSFRLGGEDSQLSEPSAGPRIRGKSGKYSIVDWGDHAVGTELVLRFEGKKVWMTVTG